MTVHCSRMKTPGKRHVPWKMQLGIRLGKKIPHEVVHYFLLGPRLKHLFATVKIEKLMRWHHAGKLTDNDVMRHPIDGEVW